VVLDPKFGDRLHEVRPGRPIWIVESSLNTPVVRAFWAAPPGLRGRTDVTLFTPKARNAAHAFLSELDMIDLHHGPYSSQTPYTQIDVLGAPLTDEIHAALEYLGFDEFRPDQSGFTAHRSEAEAQQLRRDSI
jgi:hypothetical protein